MSKAKVLIFVPFHEQYRAAAAELEGADFKGFSVSLIETGPGLIQSAAKAGAMLEPYREARDKPLLVIGLGGCASLNLKLRAGDFICSTSVVPGDWLMESDQARTYGPYGQPSYKVLGGGSADELAVNSRGPFSHELAKKLGGKGFLSGRLLSSDTYPAGFNARLERGRRFDCLASDMESAALALAAEKLGLDWINIRMVSETIDEDLKAAEDPVRDVGDLLPLKMMVVLATIEALPAASSCANCSSPCSVYKK